MPFAVGGRNFDKARQAGLLFDRSIDARISRLRKRLGDDPQDPCLIKTIYGGGYMLTSLVAWEADDEGPNGMP